MLNSISLLVRSWFRSKKEYNIEFRLFGIITSISHNRGEYSNTDTLTINHHNFIISQLNISKFYL